MRNRRLLLLIIAFAALDWFVMSAHRKPIMTSEQKTVRKHVGLIKKSTR